MLLRKLDEAFVVMLLSLENKVEMYLTLSFLAELRFFLRVVASLFIRLIFQLLKEMLHKALTN